MQPTAFGCLIVLVGSALMFGRSLSAMLVFVLVCALLGGSSVVDLPALGGSSIPPTEFALLFLVLRIFLHPAMSTGDVLVATRQNIFFVVFCVYGTATALLLPRVFAHSVSVVPMTSLGSTLDVLYAVAPLKPSAQNITTAVYLLGTLCAALGAAVVMRKEENTTLFVRAMVALVWIHIGLGILGLVLMSSGHTDWLNIIRNGHYAQLDQKFEGMQRISGVLPEPSTYAAIGFTLLAANVELWLRNVNAKATGAASLAMLAMLVLSTSSSAYIGLFGYAVVLIARLLFTPARMPLSKLAWIALIGLVTVTSALSLAVFAPHSGAKLVAMFEHMTFDKASTLSGRQRLFWAKQGYIAFLHSHGLGIGAGSFRSSSLISAIAGSTGVIGLASFGAHIFSLLNPLKAQSHNLQRDDDGRVGAAAGWAAVISIIPAVAAAAGPNPGVLFGVLSGVALAYSRPFAALVPFRRQATEATSGT